jgi:hypothetical protein
MHPTRRADTVAAVDPLDVRRVRRAVFVLHDPSSVTPSPTGTRSVGPCGERGPYPQSGSQSYSRLKADVAPGRPRRQRLRERWGADLTLRAAGVVGTSGHSSGPHLHFETHTGVPASEANAVDSAEFLRGVGVTYR